MLRFVYAECIYADCHVFVVVLGAVVLNVIMLSVMAPFLPLLNRMGLFWSLYLGFSGALSMARSNQIMQVSIQPLLQAIAAI
jgi:hypothetical protein